MSNREVYERFKEVVPPTKLEDVDIIEVEKACNTAFKIIGYKPQNFDESFSKAWRRSIADMLFEFIFDVYMEDKK